jgi:VCBS repeat protein
VVWTRHPFGSGEVRTLAVEDLEQDGKLEIIVGRASGGNTKQVSVYEPDGSVRPGFPARRDGEPGYGWGMYNENVTVADLNGDGQKEIFAPTDTHYITALDRNGNQLAANPIYGAGKVWSQVGVHVLQEIDLQGYADCGDSPPAPLPRRLRPNFANAAPATADVDGDGTLELIVPGDVYDCDVGDPDGDMYYLPWILKLDRTRWSGSGFDWTVLPTPVPGSGALSQDYNLIENAVMNAVVADLDGDGRKEILYPSYDGRLHAFWLDKTEHGAWPFDVPGAGIRFASEPAVVDLDNDGKAEVIFTSWPEKNKGLVGQLHILDYQGNQLYALNLPVPGEGADWNGGLAAPTIANIDADPDLEAVVGTSHSGVVAYDLPGSANARVLWGTGRGSQKRTGAAPAAPPTLSLSSSQPARAIAPGGGASYTISVSGLSAPVTLSAGQPVGPAPLPTVKLSPTSLTPPGQAILTLTDKHPAGTLKPGAAYQVTVTATSGSNTRTLTLHLLVGGTGVYLPSTRR